MPYKSYRAKQFNGFESVFDDIEEKGQEINYNIKEMKRKEIERKLT